MSHSLCHILAAGIGEKIDGVGAVVYVKSFYHGRRNAGIVQRVQPAGDDFFLAVADDGAAVREGSELL